MKKSLLAYHLYINSFEIVKGILMVGFKQVGDPMYIFLPKYLKRSLCKAHFPESREFSNIDSFKRKAFHLYIQQGIYK